MPKKTKKAFEEHLNKNSPVQGDGAWIINGTIRFYHMVTCRYGKALRAYDPYQFNILYNEWRRKV